MVSNWVALCWGDTYRKRIMGSIIIFIFQLNNLRHREVNILPYIHRVSKNYSDIDKGAEVLKEQKQW